MVWTNLSWTYMFYIWELSQDGSGIVQDIFWSRLGLGNDLKSSIVATVKLACNPTAVGSILDFSLPCCMRLHDPTLGVNELPSHQAWFTDSTKLKNISGGAPIIFLTSYVFNWTTYKLTYYFLIGHGTLRAISRTQTSNFICQTPFLKMSIFTFPPKPSFWVTNPSIHAVQNVPMDRTDHFGFQ